MKVCLLSITASHYRTRIYSEMNEVFKCDFIFGKDDTTVKRMDTSILGKSIDVPNIYIMKSNWYYQPGLTKLTKGYDLLINDLGIFCLSGWLLLLLSKIRGQKIYHWDHGWYGRESFIKKWTKRLYFGLADGAFIYGDYAIRLMKDNGFNGDKLYPIHNSLDYQSQLPLRHKLQHNNLFKEHFDNTYPVLIMIGRLNMRKNLNMLIEAIAILNKRGEHYNVVLVGDGEDKELLVSLVCKLQLQKQVWFYGACYDEVNNAELIFNSDMCVVPGDIGLTAIHCMMFGVPVISHDYFPDQGPEFEVIKEGVTGAFFKHNNVESLADTISQWFSIHVNDRENIRKACYKEIDENWTPEFQINVLKKVIYGTY